ncbi:hypothetical protein TWF679_002443 [Orbilia oligospora]|uniref:Uncharacterized protein n=1 Tax=Orbilia oligospora TaxID=2813651 RepID=A0A8H8UTK4_ORBOL|nr:hypothetical protein TWF679_002443 [Orbilia oligospora]
MAGTPYGKNICENDCTMAEHRLKMGESIENPAVLTAQWPDSGLWEDKTMLYISRTHNPAGTDCTMARH